MQQKPIWMPFLIIGISITLLISSCGKTTKNHRVQGEFNYTNNLDRAISIFISGNVNNENIDTIFLMPKGKIKLTTDGETHEKYTEPEYYLPAISGDTTKIVIHDTLCYAEYNRNGAVLQNIQSYTYTKRGDRDYVFYYSFDSSLLKLASKCK